MMSLSKKIFVVIFIAAFIWLIGYITIINNLYVSLKKSRQNEMALRRTLKTPTGSNKTIDKFNGLLNFTRLAQLQQINLVNLKSISTNSLSFVAVADYYQLTRFLNDLYNQCPSLSFEDFLLEKNSANENTLRCSGIINF